MCFMYGHAPFVLTAGYWVVRAPLILLQIKLRCCWWCMYQSIWEGVLYKELSCKRENQKIVRKYIPKPNYDIVSLMYGDPLY